MESVPKKRVFKHRENAIPDYDYLFNTQSEKGEKSGKHFIKGIIKLNLWQLIYSTIVYILQASPTFIMPIASANIINLVTSAVNVGSVSTAVWIDLAINAGVLLLSIALNVPFTIWRWSIVSKMLRNTSAGIKGAVIRKLQSLSITYHKDMQTGKIQSKFLKDTDSIDTLFNIIIFSIIPDVIGVIVACGTSIYKNGIVSLFFLLIIPTNILLTLAFRNKIRARNRDYRLKTESMSMKLTTMLEMFAVTKAHGLEKKEINSVEQSISNLRGSGLEMDKVSARFGASSWVVSTILSAVCLLFCSFLAIKGKIGVGDIVLYQSMFSSISAYISGLVNIMPQVSTGAEALNSVSEIMNSKDIECNISKHNNVEITGNIAFDHVYYKYPNTKQFVVQDFSLNVKKGECIAVVGASGSGKSTIMNLIIGLLVPTQGQVLIEDKPLTEFNLSEYRHNISVVPQNSILFAGSIRDNITYGLDKYTEEELANAVELANINEFVKDMPEGLNTNVGEHGDKLSGGQKQRINIARALIRNPKILILDEATSALDNISEYHVQKAIASCIKGRTTFIVAHRLSTIRDADRIVVMEEGKIVEIGSYDELMAKKGLFYQLKCLNEITLKKAEEGLQ